jgi:hypothetical protein
MNKVAEREEKSDEVQRGKRRWLRRRRRRRKRRVTSRYVRWRKRRR